MVEAVMHSPEMSEVEKRPAFNEFVFKLSSRCPLQTTLFQTRDGTQKVGGCDYCYEYSDNDLWEDEPPFMEVGVARQAAYRIDEHAKTNGIESVRIILHGGEPLALSAHKLDELLTTIDETITVRKYFLAQTNGLPITKEKLAVLKKHNVLLGISLDGDKLANDRHRLTKKGESTYDRVMRGINLANEVGVKNGRLTVFDDRNSPEHTLESLAMADPSVIDLFPTHHNNSSSPRPTGPEHLKVGPWMRRAASRYLYWDLYHPGANGEPGSRAPFRIPSIDSKVMVLRGGKSMHERVGNRYTHELFITPSGRWQRLDTLKSADNGAVVTDMNVYDHSLDDVGALDPGIRARRLASTAAEVALAEECVSCPVFDVCGAGYYPNRYKRPAVSLRPDGSVNEFVGAFRHPDADCAELKHSIGHLVLQVEEEDPTQPRRDKYLPESEVDATLASLGVAMKAGDYIQDALDKALLEVEATCPDEIVNAIRLLNHQIIFSPGPSGEMKTGLPISLDAETYVNLYWYARKSPSGRLGLQLSRLLHDYPHVPDNLYGLSAVTEMGYCGTQRPLRKAKQVVLGPWDGTEQYKDIGYYKDPDDAIVQALAVESTVGRAFKPPKRIGDLFVATSQQIDALYNARNTLEGFVHPREFDENELQASVVPEQRSFDTDNSLGFTYASETCESEPVRVGFKDLPPDLFVLEVPGATLEETEDLLDELPRLTLKYKRPYELFEALKERERPAYLLPLSGFWTPATNHMSWRVPAKHTSRPASTPHALRRIRLPAIAVGLEL